jgi:hypothetical protein
VVQAREGQCVYAQVNDQWTRVCELGRLVWGFEDPGALTKCSGWYIVAGMSLPTCGTSVNEFSS